MKVARVFVETRVCTWARLRGNKINERTRFSTFLRDRVKWRENENEEKSKKISELIRRFFNFKGRTKVSMS